MVANLGIVKAQLDADKADEAHADAQMKRIEAMVPPIESAVNRTTDIIRRR